MLENLQAEIYKAGGFINAHSHLDRANTYRLFTEKERKAFLTEKWKLVDRIKKDSTEFDIMIRILTSLRDQINSGVAFVGTFIDIDSVVGTKAIDAAFKAKQDCDGRLIIACQTLKGILDPKERILIEQSMDKIDIIGSLPGADTGRESEHLDLIMRWAKDFNKLVHVHVDQLNTPLEKETELLAKKTIEYGLEGKVTAVHGISIGAHPRSYREKVYKLCKSAGLSFITCPSAWIDHPRREDLVPSHNAITPVDELLEFGIPVAIGSDNIHDVYKPFCNGDMLFELRLLLESCKIYDVDELVNIATINGRKVLGL